MTLRFPQMSFGQTYSNAGQPNPQPRKKEPFPIEVQLGSNSVRLTREGWKLDSTEWSKAKQENRRLEQELFNLRRNLEISKEKEKDSADQARIATFQNQLLLDMLAVARTDEGQFKARLTQEMTRHAELSRSLEQAYTKIIEAGLDIGASEAP